MVGQQDSPQKRITFSRNAISFGKVMGFSNGQIGQWV
jgi:hypothetical protein